MGSTALEETEEGHEQVHSVASPVASPVARRSSLSSKCSSGVRFSGFSSIRAGARMFSLAMLALNLTWPSDFRVGAVNFTFNGFKANDVYVVAGSSWTLDSSTSCIYFDPLKPNGSNYAGGSGAAGRFLNWGLVQMTDPVSKKVKTFSTTFIYQIRILISNNSTSPGMAFIIVPDNVTVGAPGDYMGLLTATPKNYESDNHTFGVELDTHMNLEFNDPSENHIGINLASMNSTYTFKPDYDLASWSRDIYQQVWIDYFEADSRMDISYAYYGQGKPVTPQGFQRGLDLSFFEENMFIGFSSAKGIESESLPYVCAWSFSNDGLPAATIVVGLDVLPASPPSSPGLQPPAPAPAPVPPQGRTKTIKAAIGSAVALFILSLSGIIFWWICIRRHVFRIFISHRRVEDGAEKDFATKLHQRMTSRSWLRSIFRVKTYLAPWESSSYLRYGELATGYEVWVLVVSKDYFENKVGMLQLITLINASKDERGKRNRLLPLFYELTPHELRRHLVSGTWEDVWQNMEREDFPYEVEKIRQAVKELTNLPGVVYSFGSRDCDREYIEIVLAGISRIYKEWCYPWSLSCAGKRRKGARAAQEIGVITYVQKRLHLLFALSGLLTIFFSVTLDNSFNHQPERFIAFAILAPVMVFLGILTSGWLPRIPLWLIACLKRRGFLKHVSACSLWHDNVVTDFCGKICTLESLEQAEGTAFFELHRPLLRFFHGSSISPHGTTLAPEIRDFQGAASTLEPQDDYLHQTSTLQPQNEDSSTHSSQDYKDTEMSGIIEIPLPTMVRGQASLPNFQEAPFFGEFTGNVVPIDRCSKCYELHKARVPTLILKGPVINGHIVIVQCFKNTSPGSPTFDLTCTFRNETTRRTFLTTDRLHNLAQNMCRWVENPHPIVTDESSDILHSLAIQDILSEFTKGVCSFKTFHVKHRYLAGLWAVSPWIILAYVAVWSFLSLFPLISDKKSYFFLLSLFFLVPYLFTSKDSNPLYFYNLRELFCPVFIFVRTFKKLYLSRSSFIWCNEFRKLRVVNPEYFWIDGDYSNNFLDRKSCFDVCGFVDIPDTPIIQSFDMICQGLVDTSDPAKRLKQHDYKLKVTFDSVKPTCYINVTLYFYENNDLLDQKHYSEVEIKRLFLIQQLFHGYTNSCFGGYVERIYRGFWSGTYLAHSPRFLDICHRIISENQVPTLVIARRACSKFIIGVPFSSSNPEIR